jgi:N6-L-threonylcarbamoyladenine synthase
MNVLGIETSCDETSAAVVKDGVYVLSNIVASSLKEHAKFGGIIPEIASRRQMEVIHAVVEESLTKANVTFDDIDAIAVTRSPGLIGSLLVGLCFARGLARVLNKPLIEVDHIKAHVYANFLRLPTQDYDPYPTLPAVGLVVSGGHTSLFKVADATDFKLIGQTRDDAAGEAFDKVARILNLGYPGGPVIDKLAKQGVNTEIKFPAADLKGSSDFSFSGTKTAVLYYARRHEKDSNFSAAQVAYSFQESVTNVLTLKSLEACRKAGIKTLLVGGGVAANLTLRTKLLEQGPKEGIAVHFPPMSLCLDNAAMIAGLGTKQYTKQSSGALTKARRFVISKA